MTMAIIFGVTLFAALGLSFVLLMGRTSASAALLEEVTRQVRAGGPALSMWRSAVNADTMAKPFTVVRRFFSSEPDPEIVRRLMLAGYRKPYHADIFLGARLAVPSRRFGFVIDLPGSWPRSRPSHRSGWAGTARQPSCAQRGVSAD